MRSLISLEELPACESFNFQLQTSIDEFWVAQEHQNIWRRLGKILSKAVEEGVKIVKISLIDTRRSLPTALKRWLNETEWKFRHFSLALNNFHRVKLWKMRSIFCALNELETLLELRKHKFYLLLPPINMLLCRLFNFGENFENFP